MRPFSKIGALAIGLAVLAVYLLRLDDAAGLIVDDAWYIVLAKALAQGDGYRLISAATTPILPAVPPGFPLLLAPAFWIDPSFPDNVILFKALSVAAMLGVGLVSHRYFTNVRRVPPATAIALAVVTVLTPALVFLATSTVMAECVFTFTQLTGVWFIDRMIRTETAEREGPLSIGAGLVASISLLIRSAGVALIISGIALLVTRRRWRAAMVFTGVIAASQAPWMLFARERAHSRAAARTRRQHGVLVCGSLALRVSGSAGSGRASLSDVAARVRGNLSSMAGKDVGAIVLPGVYRGPAESGQEVVSIGAGQVLRAGSMGNSLGTMIISGVLGLTMLLGFICTVRNETTTAELLVPVSVLMIGLVPGWSFRYTLTLAPFLFLYLSAGIEHATRSATRAVASATPDLPQRVVRIVLAAIIGLQVLDHVQYVALARDRSAIDWLGDADEADTLLTFINSHLPPNAVVASTNPGLVYLRTGRKSIGSDDPSRNWQRWRAMGVRYVVALRTLELPPESLGYKVHLLSRRRKLWLLEMQD